MNIHIRLSEAAFLMVLTFFSTFSVGYGYGKHHAATVNPQHQQDQVVCLIPQDVAKVPKKRPVS